MTIEKITLTALNGTKRRILQSIMFFGEMFGQFDTLNGQLGEPTA